MTFTADEERDKNIKARSLEDRRIAWLEKNGFMQDHLATMVEDLKCQAANAINNKGMRVQMQYILKTVPWSEMVETLQANMRLLKQYHRTFESKLRPGGNK